MEKSMVSMEWLEDLQKIVNKFQANMANNVSRFRENLRKTQELPPVKAKGQSFIKKKNIWLFKTTPEKMKKERF